MDAVRHEPVGTIQLGNLELKPMDVVLSPDATKAYVSTGRGLRVFVIETAGNTIAGSFEVGVRPWGLAVSPDGGRLYTAKGPSNDVSVVDLGTQRVIKTIKVGERPWGVITLPKSP